MRRPLAVLVVLLAAAPAAQARVFESDLLQRVDLTYVAAESGQATVTIWKVSARAVITGPPALVDDVACIGGAPLNRCAEVRRTSGKAVIRVKRAVRVMHTHRGAFTFSVRSATALRNVWISGRGVVRLRGSGAYSADDGGTTPLTPSLGFVRVRLEA